MWVDTHCHLQLASSDPVGSLQRAESAGVGWVVVPGIDAESSTAAEQLAGLRVGLRWSAGLHPHEADQWPSQEARIVELAARSDAVGECGLDFYRNLSPREAQLSAFRAQLDLAIDFDKPVIVHCRDAFADVHELVGETGAGARTVLHCWTGGPRWTRRFRDLGCSFSFAGPLAFETGDTVRRGAAEAPPERVMVETDTPYLSPPPYRGQVNEPARVGLVGSALAEVWGMEIDEVAASTTREAERIFGG